jgi:formylglycine-generating enzyme required for sulfatase activity
LSKLAQLVAESDDSALRSGLVLAVGSVPIADALPAEKQEWKPVLANWYATAPDTPTHSSAGWALRKWNLSVPEIERSKSPSDGMNWHVNNLGMTMLKIPGGSFMRKNDSSGGDGNDQTVTLSRSFLVAAREVSRAQFQQFIDDPDSDKPTDWEGATTEWSPSERYPVQQVNWYDAVMFCNWLSGTAGLTRCYERTGEKDKPTNDDAWRLVPESNGYRLPTEAEWEYACRAGTATTYSHGDDELLLDRYAVIRANRMEVPGSKLPNGWGLFDVHGNAWEWCQDWYESFGSEAAVTDPLGPSEGSGRVLRGGSFSAIARVVRSANRNSNRPDYRPSYSGFRVARTYR